MTTPNTNDFADIATRGQEAVTTAVRTWTETMQQFTAAGKSGQPAVPDLQGVIRQYFDFAETVLASQREFAQQWAAGATKATEQAQDATRSVTEQAVQSTEAATDDVADATRTADDGVRH